MNDEREGIRQRIVSRLQQTPNGLSNTVVPGVILYRSDTPTPAIPVIYEPTICFMVQGAKQIWLGKDQLQYQELQYLLAPVTLPVSGKVIRASSDEPYLAISVNLDQRELADLIIDTSKILPTSSKCARALSIGNIDVCLISILQRLLDLLDSPQDIMVMLPLIRREMLYRLLLGPMGSKLMEFSFANSQSNRISRVIDILKLRYDQPLRIKNLADAVHMSESALFQAFKSVTSMSPLQFQKQLRLNEARRIMLHEGLEAATVSYKVGYESPSQFNREYSRLFGAPPKTDVLRFRQIL